MYDPSELSWREAGKLASLIRGSAWGVGALVIIALGGVILNVFIGKVYGPSGIGVLTQVMSIFILTAQFGTFGIQLSVLHWVAVLNSKPHRAGQALFSGLIGVSIPGIFFAVVLAAMAQPLQWVFQSVDVRFGILTSSPGIFFFALNKVLMNYLNARNRLRNVAMFQAVRFTLFVGLTVACVLNDQPIWMIGAALASSEGILFVLFIFAVRKEIRFTKRILLLSHLKRHIKFGSLSIIGATVAAMGTKVDILVLGIFLSDAMVGVYAIAALVAEGIMLIGHALRQAFNPVLAQAVRQPDRKQVMRLLKRMRKLGYISLLAGNLLGVIGYFVLIHLLGQADAYTQGWSPFLILCIGIVSVGGYVPLDMTLTQAGLPEEQTKLRVAGVCTNVIFNFLLVPKYGLNGAAFGTIISMFVSVFLLKYVVKKKLGFQI